MKTAATTAQRLPGSESPCNIADIYLKLFVVGVYAVHSTDSVSHLAEKSNEYQHQLDGSYSFHCVTSVCVTKQLLTWKATL